MMKLFDNGFSPFARKVRMVLAHNGYIYEAVDGLAKSAHDQLKAVNGRIEVPVLVDGDLAVVNSRDIVAYLEHIHPDAPVYPADPAARVRALAWEREADSKIDAILVPVSIWSWANRPDEMPAGLKEAAQADLDQIYDALERDLADQEFLCGELSIADIALSPHLNAVIPLGVGFSRKTHPNISAWLKRLRALDIVQADIARVKDYMGDLSSKGIELSKLFWRGDRIEWLLARGYHDWFMEEITQDRVLWPG